MPKDTNQLAHKILKIATGQDLEPPKQDKPKDPAAVALGRKGGLRGGKARWKSVPTDERKKQAQKAALARWHSDKS